MTELTIGFLDEVTGSLTLDDELPLANAAGADLVEMLGESQELGCARPVARQPILESTNGLFTMRIAGIWHDSLVEGAGRRSVVQMQGCPLRCEGCWVPETHDFDGGTEVACWQVAESLLDPNHERDGVTVIGGEPFAQPKPLAMLLAHLIARGTRDITVYSGFTLETLRARHDRYVDAVLIMATTLIDGRYLKNRTHSADCGCSDEVRRLSGSCNQRVIQL